MRIYKNITSNDLTLSSISKDLGIRKSTMSFKINLYKLIKNSTLSLLSIFNTFLKTVYKKSNTFKSTAPQLMSAECRVISNMFLPCLYNNRHFRLWKILPGLRIHWKLSTVLKISKKVYEVCLLKYNSIYILKVYSMLCTLW